ncbi:MAG: phosphoesterase PA-phosphatase-like protein [Promethearchaeota archaeon CR_4]|nr:MAG: phosphoesterase PA-phosphatase-like protein [Candidatus Lokiarchaeota archaeon CR_4]
MAALLSFFSPKFEKLKPYRIMFLGLVYGFVVSWLITTFVLKPLVARTRPFVQHPGAFDTYGVGDSYVTLPKSNESFPSGHATSAFGMSGALMARVKNWGWRILFYAYAVTLSLSRPFFGVHYVTDVLAGSIIGLAASLAFYLLFEYVNAKGKISEKTQKILLIIGLLICLVSIVIDILE